VFRTIHQQVCESGSFPCICSCPAVQENVEDEENIFQMLQSSQHVGTSKISICLQVPSMSAWQILYNVGLNSYHMQQIQQLEPRDMGKWLEFCCWFDPQPQLHH
jgi:hypothetical protein